MICNRLTARMANRIFKHRVHLDGLRYTTRLLGLTRHRHFFTEHFVVGALGLAIGHRLPQLCELGLGIANLGAHDQGNLDLAGQNIQCRLTHQGLHRVTTKGRANQFWLIKT